jgi:arsenate reductase
VLRRVCHGAMTAQRYNVLFLCTGNSARSIMAESILRKDARGRFEAFSAGSRPKSAVNPLALQALEHLGYPTDGLRSKNWDEFAGPDVPSMDFVITVCDNAAGEACPVWPGQPITAHWGIEDPAAVEGTEPDKRAAFHQALRFLKTRISLFLSLPIASLDKMALKSELVAIGRESGATQRSLAPARSTAPRPELPGDRRRTPS